MRSSAIGERDVSVAESQAQVEEVQEAPRTPLRVRNALCSFPSRFRSGMREALLQRHAPCEAGEEQARYVRR